MILGRRLSKLLRKNRSQEIPSPSGTETATGASRELSGGVALTQRDLYQEAYPPVASPPPSEIPIEHVEALTAARDLEDLSETELWDAIQHGAKDLILLSDEWKRRKSDDRSGKILQLLGVTASASASSRA